jgi:hypothetical protein
MHTNPTSEGPLPGHLMLSPPVVACRVRKIKDLPYGGARRRAKSGEEGTRAYAEHGMAPVTLDLEQRHEHKGPRVHFRVGQDQPVWLAPARWPSQAATPEVEHVDVETARPPVAGHAAAGPPFDALDQPQQGGRSHDGLDTQDGVDVASLAAGA